MNYRLLLKCLMIKVKCNMNVVDVVEVLGVYPPPLGGVSIHVKRLIHGLNKHRLVFLMNYGTKVMECEYIKNVSMLPLLIFSLLWKRKRIVHVHSNSYIIFFLLLLFGTRHKIGVTLHNQRIIKIKSSLKQQVFKFFLRRSDFIILNSEKYSDILVQKYRLSENRLHVLPAFIPPMESEYLGLPKDVLEFREKCDYLISANAFRLVIEDGLDLYGLDLLIELIHDLREDEYINTGLLFCLPEIGNKKYYEELLEKIADYHLEEYVKIVSGVIQNAFEYWKISDVFIRPTTTDIEGISVKEALWVNTPAIASDVCERPAGTLLFENRNYLDLKDKVLKIYKKDKYETIDFRENVPDVVNEILKIYNSL
jgi:glycosyltransferase involved in cell wall biosynthesis